MPLKLMLSLGKVWSGREDSNLRPLPPEDKFCGSKPQKCVTLRIAHAERAGNKHQNSICFTGVTPERQFAQAVGLWAASLLLPSL